MADPCALREAEFPLLKDAIYLDHAGATLASRTQLKACFQAVSTTLLANPHSMGFLGASTEEMIQSVKIKVLQWFNASPEEYCVVFTSGATDSIRIVADGFPWSEESVFLHTKEAHTSILGISSVAALHGCETIVVVGMDGLQSAATPVPALSLACVTAECNFSGKRAKNLAESVEAFQKGNFLVLLDIAKLAASAQVDIDRIGADFYPISFYKMFGYPSGIGCLIAKRKSLDMLKKRYYGGGTVSTSCSVDPTLTVFREAVDKRFEDGTVPFSLIAQLPMGFDALDRVGGMAGIASHVAGITEYCISRLSLLKHWNGAPLCKFYGNHGICTAQGPVVTFSVLDTAGVAVGHNEVERLASLSRIQLRSGCFCNAGACSDALNLTAEDIREFSAKGHVCWDDMDSIAGKPTGAVRLSFGYMTVRSDIDAVAEFLQLYFVRHSSEETATVTGPEGSASFSALHLSKIWVYAVKSCSPMAVEGRWPLGPHGLLYDREWAVVDPSSGMALKGRSCPQLLRIVPAIDLREGTITLHDRESAVAPLTLSLAFAPPTADASASHVRVCGKKCDAIGCGATASDWLSKVLQRPCMLVRKPQLLIRGTAESPISFANESQFLLITEASVETVRGLIPDPEIAESLLAEAFRANLLVSGGEAFQEDRWDAIETDDIELTSAGDCARCPTINVHPVTGIASKEPLLSLVKHRSLNGKGPVFGRFFSQQKGLGERWLHVGAKIEVKH